MSEFINGVELPRFVSHKEVQALEIGHIEGEATMGATVYFKDEQFGSLYCEAKMFARYVPQPGDFLVFYADGYKSFSPQAAFVEGYTAT
jgi:hypothetical protein